MAGGASSPSNAVSEDGWLSPVPSTGTSAEAGCVSQSLLLVLGDLFDLCVYDGNDIGLAVLRVKEGYEVVNDDAAVVGEPINDAEWAGGPLRG